MTSTNFDADGKYLIDTIKLSEKIEVFKDLKRGEDFTSRPVYEVPRKQFVDTLGIATLTGLIAYLEHSIDAKARKETFIQVKSPTRVALRTDVSDREDTRFNPVMADAEIPNIALLSSGNYVDHNDAIIELQSLFVQSTVRDALVRILGTVVADEAITLENDGFTQTVLTRSGVNARNESVENPVVLAPFRTFSEIEQPASEFVVRLAKDPGVEIALFEADGGAWKNVARQSIKKWLEDHMSPEWAVPVIA